MDIKSLISFDIETLGRQPFFKGTRVHIESLFDHLEQGISIDVFLDDFTTVTKEQTIGVLEIASKLFSARNFSQLYETVT
jgi:uncharacterized protein (DUF433 family)